MNGLFGNCGGGNMFNHGNGFYNGCNDNNNSGIDCCTIILLLLLTSCCGCDIDWCTLIIIFVLFNSCEFGCGHNCDR